MCFCLCLLLFSCDHHIVCEYEFILTSSKGVETDSDKGKISVTDFSFQYESNSQNHNQVYVPNINFKDTLQIHDIAQITFLECFYTQQFKDEEFFLYSYRENSKKPLNFIIASRRFGILGISKINEEQKAILKSVCATNFNINSRSFFFDKLDMFNKNKQSNYE